MLSPIVRQIDPANSLTLLSLGLGFLSVMLAWNHQFYLAAICIMYAGIIDLFDGLVARAIQRTERQREVGKQLDSLVDLCSFGFAPAVFAYSYGLQGIASIFILLVYLCACALRLAYFNCIGLVKLNQREYFIGLPITYAALFVPVIFLFGFVLPQQMTVYLLNVVYAALALAMLSNFKMLKLTGIWYAIFSVGAVIVTGIYLWASILKL